MDSLTCLNYQIKISKSPFDPSSLPSTSWFLITDSTLYRHYAPLIHQWSLPHYVIPAGQLSKTRKTKEAIQDFLLSHGCTRASGLIAFGGGVVTDLTGYVASTYMRGIRYVSVPTTLLAMVDSAIGGKTGVDTVLGKNLIGTIWQPSGVFICTDFLKTLAQEELWAAGVSQVIKIASMVDPQLQALLSRHSLEDLRTNEDLLIRIVYASVKAKANIVSLDQRESAARVALNFGHTIGHAIEAQYFGSINHGNCIAYGMIKQLQVCEFLGIPCAPSTKMRALLQQYQAGQAILVDWPAALNRMLVDKKRTASHVVFAVPLGLGNWKTVSLQIADLRLALAEVLHVRTVTPQETPISIPGSKSLTNRVLLLSSLAPGRTHIKGMLRSDDTEYMVEALCALGLASIEQGHNEAVVNSTPPVEGAEKHVYVGNAGTVCRFLAAVCAYLPFNTILGGDPRMNERPIGDLVDAINSDDRVEYLGKEGSTPLKITGGVLRGGDVHVRSSVSSQFVSAILMAAPFAQSPTNIILEDVAPGKRPVSESYIEMTIAVMRLFGASVQKRDSQTYWVDNKSYTSPGEVTIDIDACSASYFFAIAAISCTHISVKGRCNRQMQGELEFLDILGSMGCQVEFSDDLISVKGGALRPLSVDMSRCTDSFMTLAVVMAATEGVSQIRGVANQRVKESNRIAAMAKELSKLGVSVKELPDGLEIHGKGRLHSAEIDTYGDHRIAMAFAALSAKVPLIVRDPGVVSKTFPEFWVRLRQAGALIRDGRTKPQTLVLVGMRGAGKTTLGKAAAEDLGWDFVDLDEVIGERVGSIVEYVAREGMEKFRELEYAQLVECLNRPQTVVSTGGGVVEHRLALDLLQSHYPVVWVKTSMDNIRRNIDSGAANPHRVTGDLESTYNSRAKLYEACSDYVFLYERRIKDGFRRFVDKVLRRSEALPVDFTYFASVAVQPDSVRPQITAIQARVDLIQDYQRFYTSIAERFSEKQTILTLRTQQQGGAFKGDYWELVCTLAKLLPDWIDIEFRHSAVFFRRWIEFRARFPTLKVILSYHSPSKDGFYDAMASLAPEVLKYISPLDSTPYYPRTVHFTLDSPLSRVQNRLFSPVRLGEPMGRGQFTYQELSGLQVQTGVRPKGFVVYLVGSDVALSPGPFVFNRLFEQLGLPLRYELLQTGSLDSVMELIRGKDCLGCSVTMPFKEEVRKFLAEESSSASKVGSVNTVVKYNGLLAGFNTDWWGIFFPLRGLVGRLGVCCVMGAGGTCKAAVYVAHKLRCRRIIVWNRTEERLREYPHCETTCRIEEVPGVDLLISTLPGAACVEFPKLCKETVVFDVSYFPEDNALRRQARALGCSLFTGKDMWGNQACVQAELFTSLHVDYERVKQILELSQLNKRAED